MQTMEPGRKVDDWIPTRQSLLSRLRDWDDRESWEDFFNCYWKLIYNAALKSGLTVVEAQEVVQETVIKVAKQMPEFRYDPAKGSFKGWLLKITQWRISDQFRKRRDFVPLNFEAGGEGEGMEEPMALGFESKWDELWQENLLEVAVARVKQRVDPREFQMFEMTAQRDWPALKVARKLNVLRAHVYYARHKVARLIREEMNRLEGNAARKLSTPPV
jgi:RNA polymerase sigma factor (sigma-70 family)